MDKAFIFDMDGVIIDTERVWERYEQEFYNRLFGEEIASKLASDVGGNLAEIYQLALMYGVVMSTEQFYQAYYDMARVVYMEASITEKFEETVQRLKEMNVKLALVSASPNSWIELMLLKTNIRPSFDYILSLHEQDVLEHKPSPDGYIAAMKYLQSSPETTIVLEDSNRGIQSAKSSGAFTIGFTQNLQEGYIQTGADIYANTMDDVLHIVKERFYE